jgi:glycosyltransferase involved in cell wall biosynthesis
VNPLVSVVIPVYKVEPYLRQCLDSVVNQSYTNLEIILVDDGSPDTCGEICESYAAQDLRIRVLHQGNQGLSGARNSGMACATGEYLMFVDSDDWIFHGLTEKLVERALATGADLVQCRVNYAYEDGTMEKSRIFGPDEIESVEISDANREEVYYQWVLSGYIWDCAWGRLYLRSRVEALRLRYVDTKLVCNEDFLFTLCLFTKLRRVEIVQEPLYNYRQRGDSLTQAGSYPHRIACRPQLFLEFNAYLRQSGAKRKFRRVVLGETIHRILLMDYREAWRLDVDEQAGGQALDTFFGLRKQKAYKRLLRQVAFTKPIGNRRFAARLHRYLLLLSFAYGGTRRYLLWVERFAPSIQ